MFLFWISFAYGFVCVFEVFVQAALEHFPEEIWTELRSSWPGVDPVSYYEQRLWFSWVGPRNETMVLKLFWNGLQILIKGIFHEDALEMEALAEFLPERFWKIENLL